MDHALGRCSPDWGFDEQLNRQWLMHLVTPPTRGGSRLLPHVTQTLSGCARPANTAGSCQTWLLVLLATCKSSSPEIVPPAHPILQKGLPTNRPWHGAGAVGGSCRRSRARAYTRRSLPRYARRHVVVVVVVAAAVAVLNPKARVPAYKFTIDFGPEEGTRTSSRG